ncbi:GNAT family N-acetyltransferase [Melghirimyces algeriensis]|uniref:N-acetyltransferase domain-containing protein n=1 Tax=Melghirimyces algeriensis TaxID=910412 RepID=A0A521EFC9_9BACL|nr:GNAT family N-acetyltransferase [Melghirimyces algeriensis]SMO82599.1 hypothetical protein SAMN06264849_10914 [Melghirimyces algeriensis]
MVVDLKQMASKHLEKNNYRVKGHQVIIRQAVPEDAEELRKRFARVVQEEVYLDETPDDLPDIREKRREIKEIRDSEGMYAVVKVDGKIAGSAQLKRGSKGISHHTAQFRTWLTPGYRGMGLGKKLMEYTINWAKKHGIEKINLDVWDTNDRAIRLYRKYGFRVEGCRRRQAIFDGKYVDEVFMARFL